MQRVYATGHGQPGGLSHRLPTIRSAEAPPAHRILDPARPVAIPRSAWLQQEDPGQAVRVMTPTAEGAACRVLISLVTTSVGSTSCRTHQHATGARKRRPRVPGKEQRPGSTAPTRGSDAPGAVLSARFSLPVRADAPQAPTQRSTSERSRADDQRVERFPGRGHKVRQARPHLPRHPHRRLDPTLAPPVISGEFNRRSCRRASRAGCPGGRCGGLSPR
jgi:hypothetical protein